VCRLRRAPLFGYADQLDHVCRSSLKTQRPLMVLSSTVTGSVQNRAGHRTRIRLRPYIRSVRLTVASPSPEGLESEPYELKSDDTFVSLQLYYDLSL
jgi:hypothetical protein